MIATKLNLNAWTHPASGEVRVYVNGHGERHGKVWIGRSEKFSHQDFEFFKSGQFDNFSAYSGKGGPAVAIGVAALDAAGIGTLDVTFDQIVEAVR